MLCDGKLCTGCGACRNACPREAITMCENEHGFLIPRIDESRCVECGLCETVCPVKEPVQANHQAQCFVAWCKDTELRKTAASAGVISALMRQTLRSDGVVFGTRYRDGKLIFDYIEEENAIPRFQGSKYVHADVGIAYRQVRDFLNQGRRVLFPGTPCQIAGLRNYLGREYEQLLTVDLVCHGVTSGEYLKDYLRYRRNDLTYDRVLFRGEHGQKLVVYHRDQAVWIEDKVASPFYMAYAKGLIHRENCYHCPYTSANRCSDLTVGDFWGINRENLPQGAEGLSYPSLVLVHTPKGFDALSQGCIRFEERAFEEALPGNRQLSTPCSRHPNRDVFLRFYPQKGFYRALKKTAFFRCVQVDTVWHRTLSLLSILKHRIIK